MDEIATDSSPLVEVPVADNTLFLLHERNRDLLNGKTNMPVLKDSGSFLGSVIILILGLPILAFWWLTGILRDFRAPSWIGDHSWLFALYGTLAIIGLLVVLHGMYVTRQQHQGLPQATAAKAEVPVAPVQQPAVSAKPKGLILTGEVVHAEKIRHEGRNGTEVKVGVRYRFAAPGGVITEGQAEGDIRVASHDMAPIPGTPIRVWYTDNEKFYLL